MAAMAKVLLLLSPGLFWTLTYVLVIRQGFRDRTYGMPLVALCANISWEFIFSVVRPQPGGAQIVYVVWFCFDVVIAYTALRYGPREFPGLPRSVFYLGFAATLVSTPDGNTFTYSQYEGWLREAGFEDVRPVEAFGQTIVFATRAG